MKKRISNTSILIAIISLFTGLITSLIEIPLGTRSLPPATMASLSMEYIAPAENSPETSVATKVVAEKVDLERKLIVPRSDQEREEIINIIQESGGEVVSQDEVIVAQIGKDIEEEVQTKLVQENVTSSFEVDYPTFLTTDNPDWGVVRIAAPDVWETTAAEGIRIAVVDTGIDYSHPDLAGRYSGGYDTVNEDSDPFDDHGHGTHVAGIIAADLNQSGIAGVSPQASVFALKALAADGSGYISDLIQAIDWAVDNGAQVINFSLGTTYDSSVLEEALNQAASRGVILVAAAGNTNGGAVLYPAAYGPVISVAATDSNDGFASFSSVGAEVAAPGVAIKSTVPGGGYATWSGTSMAAPHVTATTALMLSNGQSNIRQLLRDTAIDLGVPGTDSLYGYGLVHAKPAALGDDTLSPLVTFKSPENGATVSDTVTVSVDVQDENSLSSIELFINGHLQATSQESSFIYEWDTSQLASGEYELWVKAADIFENIGEAKITVYLDLSASPTPTPTPSDAATPPGQLKKNQSTDTNTGNANPNALEKRGGPKKQEEITPKTTPVPQSQSVPETSNINERQQQSQREDPSTSSEETIQNTSGEDQGGGRPSELSGKGNARVKGAQTNRFIELLRRFFLPMFN